jgi:hypothetical protein
MHQDLSSKLDCSQINSNIKGFKGRCLTGARHWQKKGKVSQVCPSQMSLPPSRTADSPTGPASPSRALRDIASVAGGTAHGSISSFVLLHVRHGACEPVKPETREKNSQTSTNTSSNLNARDLYAFLCSRDLEGRSCCNENNAQLESDYYDRGLRTYICKKLEVKAFNGD